MLLRIAEDLGKAGQNCIACKTAMEWSRRRLGGQSMGSRCALCLRYEKISNVSFIYQIEQDTATQIEQA